MIALLRSRFDRGGAFQARTSLKPINKEGSTPMSTDFSADWERFDKAAAKANRLNKALVFEALEQAGITHVRVGFDGEDDQGQMERAFAQSDGKTVEFPPESLTLWEAAFGCADLSSCELGLQDAVEHLCYGYLEARHGGWEINDGSFGEFTFDVARRTITLDFYGRLVDTDYTNHIL